MTERANIHAVLDQVALAYGGLDAVAVTAGIIVSPDTTGQIITVDGGLHEAFLG